MRFVNGEMEPNPALNAFVILLGEIKENNDDVDVYEIEVKINGVIVDFNKLIERYNTSFSQLVDEAARDKVEKLFQEKAGKVNELLEKIGDELRL